MKSLGKKVEVAKQETGASPRTINEIVRSDPNFWDKHPDKCYNLLLTTHDDKSLIEYFRNALNNVSEDQ